MSPQNPDNPYLRTTHADQILTPIHDTSTYGNWELPGGPLEHIELASQAAQFLAKHFPQLGVDPLHAAAAAALHDEGRGVTHLFYTNELIGKHLLTNIHVRSDLLDVMPSEDIMLTPPETSMDAAIEALPAETVLIRISDEFGKRFPGTNRLYQPHDYDAWDRQKWADGYTNRPLSGRASDAWWRTQRQLHVDNVPRYFTALDTWTRNHLALPLASVTAQLQEHLGSSLRPLVQK